MGKMWLLPILLGLGASASTPGWKNSFADVYAVSSTHFVGDTMSNITKTLCTEVAAVDRVLAKLGAECDTPLRNLVTHFRYKAYLLQKHHFAQTLARNSVVTATARRSIMERNKAPVQAFTASSAYSGEYGELDQQVTAANMRLINARQQAKNTMASMSDTFMADVADFSRFCNDGGNRLVDHLDRFEKETTQEQSYGPIVAKHLPGLDKQEQKIFGLSALTDPCAASLKPLKQTVDELRAAIEVAKQMWMTPLRELSQLWTDSNREYATDIATDKAVLDFALHCDATRPNGNGNTWADDMERATVVSQLERQQAAKSNAKFVALLPQKQLPSERRMETEASETARRVARAEENVAASTATIAATYRRFAQTMDMQLKAAAMRGKTTAAIRATELQAEAAEALNHIIMKSTKVVNTAAALSGNWGPPKPFTYAPLSSGTSLQQVSTAPKDVYGDVTLAVQKTRGLLEESAAAARAGQTGSHLLLGHEVAAARKHLEEQVRKMGKYRAPRPDLVTVNEAIARRDRAAIKEVELRQVVTTKVEERDEAIRQGSAPARSVPSNEERLAKLTSEVTGIVRASEAERAKRSLFLHHQKLIQAQQNAGYVSNLNLHGQQAITE